MSLLTSRLITVIHLNIEMTITGFLKVRKKILLLRFCKISIQMKLWTKMIFY